MAFKASGSLNPHGSPVLRKVILANSVTFTEEDSVKFASGFGAAGTEGALVAGHIRGLIANSGIGLNTTGIAGAAIGSFAGAYLTASDNQTVAKVSALLDVSKFTLYSVAPSATIGTTTGSNLLGYFTDLNSASATKETSATTSTAQYLIWGVDPLVSANQIVNIYESHVFGV